MSMSDKAQAAKEYMGDSAITAAVKAKLLAADGVPSMDISVETVEGVVQLTGSVEKPSQSDSAESVAKEVDGVKSVKNELSVKS